MDPRWLHTEDTTRNVIEVLKETQILLHNSGDVESKRHCRLWDRFRNHTSEGTKRHFITLSRHVLSNIHATKKRK